MPVYTFTCTGCEKEQDFMRSVDERNIETVCECGKKMTRTPERFTPDTFEEYYDEGLGSDVYSRRHKRAIMARQGVIEAGDPVHGGRNFDSKMPHLATKQPVKGKVWKAPKERNEDAQVMTVDEKGRVTSTHTIDDLPNAGKKS